MNRRCGFALMVALLSGVGCRVPLARESVPPTHPRGVVAGSLALTGRPHGITTAPGGEFCVSQIDAASITCGTVTATNAVLGPAIRVGAGPAHVALDPAGRVAYTANQFGGTASIVDVATAHVAGSVPLGDGGFNVAASRTRAYVTTAGGQLFAIDAGTREAITQLGVGSAANGLALDTIGGMLYVSSRDAGTVTAINTATNALTRTYMVGRGAQRIALTLDRAALYIANEGSGVQALGLASGALTVVPGVSVGTVGLALSPDGARLYVTNPPAGTVQIIEPAAGRVLATLTGLGTPRNVAFGANGATALVTNEGGSVILIR